MSLDNDLREWGESRALPSPSSADTAALLEAARSRQAGRSWRVVAPVVLAVAAALLVWLLWPSPEEPPALVVSPVEPTQEPAVELPPEPIWLAEGAQAVGSDEVVVGSGTRVQVVESGPRTLLTLASGTVTAQVTPRQSDGAFAIETDGYRVEVVGTRFTVQEAPFEVHVEEGVVEVVAGDERWRVAAGGRFIDGRVVEPVPPAPILPALPELSDLRQQVIAGELEAARQGIQTRLSRNGRDAESWALLAQIEGKASDPAAALIAWRQVIDSGTPAQAQRARYEAARLVTDPVEAEALLRVFLTEAGPLTADARLRLAQALIAQGRRDDARTELSRIVAEHPGTGPAQVARGLMQTL